MSEQSQDERDATDLVSLSPAVAKDLLLKDYDYLSDSFWKNEQIGETRFNFFVGLATLVVSALVTVFTSEHFKPSELERVLIAHGALISLIAFGIVTLLRIIIRNERTDDIKRGLDHIRQRIKDYSYIGGGVDGYYPVGSSVLPKDGEPVSSRRRKWGQLRPRRFGGLAHSVAVINALLIAGMAASYLVESEICSSDCIVPVSIGSLAAFLFVLFAQAAYIGCRGRSHREKTRSGEYSHAGGIVYRMTTVGPEFLLVRAKADPTQWVLPKGHIRREVGEGHGEAAMREVEEESGVIAQTVAPLGASCFRAGGEDIRAKFYLMEYLYAGEPAEVREIGWFPLEDALESVGFAESRRLLALAKARIR